MRMTIKERAGVEDVSRIYDGLHLSEGFIRNSATAPGDLSAEMTEEGDRHFNICEECRNQRSSFLSLDDSS